MYSSCTAGCDPTKSRGAWKSPSESNTNLGNKNKKQDHDHNRCLAFEIFRVKARANLPTASSIPTQKINHRTQLCAGTHLGSSFCIRRQETWSMVQREWVRTVEQVQFHPTDFLHRKQGSYKASGMALHEPWYRHNVDYLAKIDCQSQPLGAVMGNCPILQHTRSWLAVAESGFNSRPSGPLQDKCFSGSDNLPFCCRCLASKSVFGTLQQVCY